MVTCEDILSFLDQIAPCELAEEWDNIGLMTGSRGATVERILVCLDVTAASLKKAAEIKADLIVTHHPVIFKGIKRVCEDEAKGNQIYAAIRSGVSVISAHTNLDYADEGVNMQLASVLGLKDTVILGAGPGRIGVLEKRMSRNEFISHVKERLEVSHVRAAGKADAGILKVAVFSGSFDDDLDTVLVSGADAVVTGDLKYHTALDAGESGLFIIDAGHFATERIVLPYLTAALAEKFPDVDVIRFSEESDPFITY